MIWSPPRRWSSSRQQFYKQFNKPTLTISHCPCKIKLDAFYFIFCIFYMAARASAQEPFLTYENNHNSDKTIVSITPLSGPSIVNAISTIVGDTDTRQPHIRYKPYVKCGTSLA